MNASEDYQLAQSITAGSDKLISMEEERSRCGNANVKASYDIARQESASSTPVGSDYYRASDFIVKRFLLIS